MKAANTVDPGKAPKREAGSHRGFSLIEVLIALAIFGMAVTYISSAFVSALLARERAVSNDQLNADIRLARMQLLLEPNLEDAEDGGSVETLNSGEANWEARISPTNVIDLFEVTFMVELSEPVGFENAITHEETLYLLRPTWSDSDDRATLLQEKRDALLDQRDFGSF